MGLAIVQLMVPFVRTVGEGRGIVDLLAEHGRKQGENDLKLIMMCEIPSNAPLAEDFFKIFGGFSIGSNELTLLIIDRDPAEWLMDQGTSSISLNPDAAVDTWMQLASPQKG